jgi:hypothetical protein
MDRITVTKSSDTLFEVSIESRTNTHHRVTVPTAYYRKLTDGKVSPEELVRKSFEFLLQREPNTSILQSFELSLIGHYFPDYEQKIRLQLRGA